MGDKHDPGPAEGWKHQVVPLKPVEVATLQRQYVASLGVPTLTELELALRENLLPLGVRVGEQAVAFALIQPEARDGFPFPLLLSLAAPGQSATELRPFFRAVVAQGQVRGVLARSDDPLLLEVLLLEGWRLSAVGPLLTLEQVEPQPLPPGLEVRHLFPADLDEVCQLLSRISEAPVLLRDRQEVRKQLQDRILDGILEGPRLMGVARILPQLQPAFVGLEVLVDPAARRRGLGRLLGIEVAFEELQAGRVLVCAFRSEEVASRRLVESMGARAAALYYLATPPPRNNQSPGSSRAPGWVL